jgi:hypothetical protein
MKIYISEKMGTIYHLLGDELAFTPMSRYDEVYELDGNDKPYKEQFLHNESGLVDWENIDPEIIKPLRKIQEILSK